MTKHTLRRGTTALVIGLTVLLIGSSPASATTTVLTDPTGDATICNGVATNWPQNTLCPSVGSEPTVDIVSGSLGTSASADLVAELTVLDLDDPLTTSRKDTWYSFGLHYDYDDGSAELIQLTAERRGDAIVGKAYVTGSTAVTVITPVTFDYAANTVRWELTLARLNELIDMACPACDDLAVGSPLTYFSLWTLAPTTSVYVDVPTSGEISGGVLNREDRAYSEVVYEIGD